MKKENIKRHLNAYSIFKKRKTTINHAFASAMAPNDVYDEDTVVKALDFLGQKPNEALSCIYCQKPAQTWDHLVSLVKNGKLQGFGHQIGNLVPSCKDCNSAKAGKLHKDFIENNPKVKTDNKQALINNLNEYQKRFTQKLKLEEIEKTELYMEYKQIKEKIFQLMAAGDSVADKLRANIR